MNVGQLEEVLWNRDGVRVVVRAPWSAPVQASNQTKAADKGMRVNEYLRVRVQDSIGDYQCFVVDGYGLVVNGNTKLETVRASYRA